VAALDLSGLTRRRAGELSAGQKRRLGLARLLVTGRPLWLLDEPTVSLDVASVALFAGVVRQHLAGGGAAIVATHVDLGLPEAPILDLDPHRVRIMVRDGFDEAFA
jgi:heme exporter protein A